jgi:hypothetical protein
MMWFHLPKQTDWVPLELEKVNEILEMNKKGIKAESLKGFAVESDLPEVELNTDLLSETDLSRFDNTKTARPKGNKRPANKNSPKGKRPFKKRLNKKKE